MAITLPASCRFQNWFNGIIDADRLEAPDRTFVGHRDILTRSLARYSFVKHHVRGATLDVGCGRGYGFEVIQADTRTQVGIDISYPFLRDAQATFPTTPFACASGEAIPFASGSFDSVIAFEVIEHLQDDKFFLHELKRLVRDDGCIAISTPNKLITSGDADKPLNKFHVREYTAIEFRQLLNSVFSSVDLYGQYEGGDEAGSVNSIIDRIPVQWKYMLPLYAQGLLSAVLRPPLPIEACRFRPDRLDTTHTFVAICRP